MASIFSKSVVSKVVKIRSDLIIHRCFWMLGDVSSFYPHRRYWCLNR